MQALCAFAHASEASVRENQWIRWRIVHGGDKGNKPPAFCIPLVGYRINFLRVRRKLIKIKSHHHTMLICDDDNNPPPHNTLYHLLDLEISGMK